MMKTNDPYTPSAAAPDRTVEEPLIKVRYSAFGLSSATLQVAAAVFLGIYFAREYGPIVYAVAGLIAALHFLASYRMFTSPWIVLYPDRIVLRRGILRGYTSYPITQRISATNAIGANKKDWREFQRLLEKLRESGRAPER